MSILYSTEYDSCRMWAKKKRNNKNVSWEELRYACKGDDKGLHAFLEQRKDEDGWPAELNNDLWKQMIAELEEVERRKLMTSATIVANPDEHSNITIPEDERSSWQLYRKHLRNGDFSDEAIENIEDSCLKILKQLSKDTNNDNGPIKGLVVGNVQSGKTANMAGLIAMAADWGWNMFIILSGTIENLRKQTQARLYGDLNHPGNLVWNQFDHLSKNKSPIGQRLRDLQLQPGSNARYMTVCLKVKSRLSDLIEWIEADTNNIQNLKVLVIDDEADQASINTGNVYSEDDRKTINRLILNLVHCKSVFAGYKDKNGKVLQNAYTSHYKAMNYISYTATPYANCLNERGHSTLYPKDFIHTLSVARSYFGPQKIFGTGEPGVDDKLGIVNTISDDDYNAIIDAQKNGSGTIPQSMKDAICWFITSAAFMRYYNYKKPVSMLVHTSQKQEHHAIIAMMIQKWITDNSSKIPKLCKGVYEKQKEKLTVELLREKYPEYEHPDNEIWNYPSYDHLLVYIKELVSNITPIEMREETGELEYHRWIHLCIDNCANNGVNDEGMHVRLAYPDKANPNYPDYSTAFIVIGGNTLSRGLTLEGLVSTFFLRNSTQMDTLMQMGRWFGYRYHYELLPRIWMTSDCKEKYEFLTSADSDLREQIRQLMIAGMRPLDFRLTFLASPFASWLRLTSESKSQMAELTGYDFSGMDPQLIVYPKDANKLASNITITDNFLTSLGEPRASENTSAYIWNNISFAVIKKKLFDEGFYVAETSKAFQQIDLLTEWIEDQTQKGNMTAWNVLMCGTNPDSETDDRLWKISSGYSVGKISRSCKSESNSSSGKQVNIGVLSGKRDYLADITEGMVSPETWKKIRASAKVSLEYKIYREEAGVDKTPLLVIYMIDKNSKPSPGKEKDRTPLNVDEDIIGLTMVLPGVRGKLITKTRLTIKSIPVDREVES